MRGPPTAGEPLTQQPFVAILDQGVALEVAVRAVNNGDNLDYTDWKLGVTYAAPGGWNFGAYYTDTNAKDAGYTLAGRNIGKATGTVFVQKTF